MSIVDYTISSPFIFPHLAEFYIDECNECISDVHTPVYLTLVSDNNQQHANHAYHVWRQEFSVDFLTSISEDNVNYFTVLLNRLLENVHDVTQILLYCHHPL